MVKRLIAVALLFVSGFAAAGYYATATAPTVTYCGPAPISSGCYLTIGMAIKATCPTTVNNIIALDADAKTWTSNYVAGQYVASGIYGECTALAQGGGQPAFEGAYSDPSVLPTGVAGGSSTGGSEEMFDLEVFELAAGAALLMFVTGFGIGLVIQLIRRLRTP